MKKLSVCIILFLLPSLLPAKTGFQKKKHFVDFSGGSAGSFRGRFSEVTRAQTGAGGILLFQGDPAGYFLLNSLIKSDIESPGNYARGSYEYGFFRFMGIGIQADNLSFRISNFSSFNPYNIPFMYTMYNSYESSGLARSGSFNPLYSSFSGYYAGITALMGTMSMVTEKMSLATVGTFVTFHPVPGRSFDPYIKLSIGRGQELEHHFNIIQKGAGIGFRLFFTDNFYVFTEGNYYDYEMRSPSMNEFNWEANSRVPNGNLISSVIHAGFGMNTDFFNAEQEQERQTESVMSAVQNEKISVTDIRRQELLDYLEALKVVETGLELFDDDGVIKIRLPNDIVFEPGSENLMQGGATVLGQIAEILIKYKYHFRVEGHTDNTPTLETRFLSNWELASSRAINVVRLFKKAGISESRMGIISYGENMPIASNLTERGRSRNRRIEIVILLNSNKNDSAAP